MFEIKLGIQALLRNRKRTITTLSLMSLLIVFIVLINVLVFSNRTTNDLRLEKMYGAWTHAFLDKDQFDTFEKIGTYHKVSDSVGSFDKNMFELSNFEYYKGRAPLHKNEIVVTLDSLNMLGIDYELNQSVDIDGHQYQVVGIIYDYHLDWIWIEEINYPTIITTGITSGDLIYFGKAKALTPFYELNDYLEINTHGYPYISSDGQVYRVRSDETDAMNLHSLKFTQLILIITIMVVSVIFKLNSDFYQKRFDLLSQQGISKLGLFRYVLPQLILYTLWVPLIFYLIPMLFENLFSFNPDLRYDNNLNNLSYACVRMKYVVLILLIVTFISEKYNLESKLSFKFIQIILVFVIFFSTVFMVTPKTTVFYEERLPLWREYETVWEINLNYKGDGSWGSFKGFWNTNLSFDEENNEWSQYLNYDQRWVPKDFEMLLEHPKTQYLFYWNRMFLETVDQMIPHTTVNYFDEVTLRELEWYGSQSDQFKKGHSFHIISIEDDFEIRIGSTVLFNGIPFTYEGVISPHDSTEYGHHFSTGLYISEAGAKRLGFPTEDYNMFLVGVEKMRDFLEYDTLVRRVSQRAILNNSRVNVERGIRNEHGVTLFIMLEVLVQYGLGLAILSLLFLQSLMFKRKTMAIYHFLGESKKKMMFKNSVTFIVPAFFGVLPAILMRSKMEIRTDSLIFASLLGFSFIVLLWVLCIIIHLYYLKGSLFELLDERE